MSDACFVIPHVCAQWNPTVAPGVEAHVVYGLGHPSPTTYTFATSSWSSDTDWNTATIHCTDGDNLASQDALEGVPTRWRAQGLQQRKAVHLYNVGIGHVAEGHPAGDHGSTPRITEGLQVLIAVVNATS